MSDQIEFHPDGPHSPNYTREVASAFGEAVRVLNHATFSAHMGGLEYPSTVYNVLGSLKGGIGGLEQLFQQLGDFLTTLEHEGQLEVRHGQFKGNHAGAVNAVRTNLAAATSAANQLYQALDWAHNAASAIGKPYAPEDDG